MRIFEQSHESCSKHSLYFSKILLLVIMLALPVVGWLETKKGKPNNNWFFMLFIFMNEEKNWNMWIAKSIGT